MSLLIYPNGTIVQCQPSHGRVYSLQDLYALLEVQSVEVLPVYSHPQLLLVIDEEGKLKEKAEVNPLATSLFGGDLIVGRALLCKFDELE